MIRTARAYWAHLPILAVMLASAPAAKAECPDPTCKAIIIVVPFPPGGFVDSVARLLAGALNQRFRRVVNIQNLPGAAGNLAAREVANANPDDSKLLMVTTSAAVNVTTMKDSIDISRAITPIVGIARIPDVLVVSPSLPAKTLSEFIAFAKANPGKIAMASLGTGTPNHLAGELFKLKAGIQTEHVPYRAGGEMIAALITNQAQAGLVFPEMALRLIRDHNLRALAVTGMARLKALPEIPTVAETIPSYDASGWLGLGAPKDTPPDIVNTLNQQVNAVLKEDETLKGRLEQSGATPLGGTPADFGRLIADEIKKWAEVVKAADIKMQMQ